MKIFPRKSSRPERRGAGRFPVWFVSVLLGAVIFSTTFLFSQEGEPREGVTFWLLDDEGNWKVPLPNWSVDDVAALLDESRRQRETTPFTIESLKMEGEASDSQARLTIEYRISLSLPSGSSDPIRVPLGMKEGVFRSEGDGGAANFTADGPGKVVLDVDRQTGGYAALIRPNSDPEDAAENHAEPDAGEDGETSDGGSAEPPAPKELSDIPSAAEPTAAAIQVYTVRLVLLFPVTQTPGSDEKVLFLTPPPAVESQAQIVVPLPDVEFSASEGAITGSPANIDEKSSRLNVYGFNRGGVSTAIRWRSAEKNEADLPTTYRVENAVINLNPTGGGIEYDVVLPIRINGGSRGALNRSLRVDLPKGATLDPQNVHVSSGGTAVSNATIRENKADDNRPFPTVEVSIPVDIDSLVLHMTVFVPTEKEGENQWECTGFRLDGALKETGEIVVHLPDDEENLPGLVCGGGVREIDQPDAAEGGEKTARFRFFKVPFSLKSIPIPRKTRLIARPEYQVQVGESEIRLKARVSYSAYGAPLRSVRVNNMDWDFRGSDSESGIDDVGITTDAEGVSTFPLKKQVEGDFVLSWELVRSPNVSQKLAEFKLPELSADWIDSPILTVVPDDNVELIPRPGGMKRLTLQLGAGGRSTIELPRREQTPLVYQVRRPTTADEGPPVFSARLIPHNAGEVTVDSSLSVQLERGSAETIQTLVYHIKYVPVRSLDFVVPQKISSITDRGVFLNGKEVVPKRLSSGKDAGGGDVVRYELPLADTGLIGDVRLEFHAGLDLPEPNSLNIPLAVPFGSSGTSSAEVTAPLEYSLHTSDEEPDGGKTEGEKPSSEKPDYGRKNGENYWKKTSTIQKGNVRHFGFSNSSLPQWLHLRVVVDKNSQMVGGLIAKYIWAQTFLKKDSYYERIRFCLIGNRRDFSLRLPEQVDRGEIAASIDGVPVEAFTLDEERVLTFSLPDKAKTESTVVSIWYKVSSGAHKLEFPGLMNNMMVRRCYMQLILPAGTILRQTPRGWNSEGDLFHRHPETELAEGIGMSLDEADKPPAGAEVYLLSSFDPPTSVHIHLINRSVFILLASGPILVFGALFTYISRRRHILEVFAAIGVALLFLLFRPQIVAFYLLFAVPGIVLFLTVFLLHGYVQRRRTSASVPEAVAPSRPSSVQRTPRLGSTAAKPETGSKSSAPSPSETGTKSSAPSPSETGSEPSSPSPSETGSEPSSPSPSETGSEPSAPSPSETEPESSSPSPSETGSEPSSPSPSEAGSEPSSPSPSEAEPESSAPLRAETETPPSAEEPKTEEP